MPVPSVSILCKFGLALLSVLFLVNSASAYVGPGAGLELIGYTMGLVYLGFTAFSAVLLWPLYALLRRIRGRAKTSAGPPTPASTGETGAESNVRP